MQDAAGVGEEQEVVEARREIAVALRHLPGLWNSDQRLQVHRLVRETSPAVWQAACETLGRRAGWDPLARQELLALLSSPSWEIRLRGLAALRPLGEEDSSEVLPFLEQRLHEAAAVGDAALLDTIVLGMAHLEGEPLAYRLLRDPREIVRATVAAHLEGAAPALLEAAAQDPALRVRVALASSLGRFSPLPEAAIRRLVEDPDPIVRSTLADELPREEPAALPFLEQLASDPDPLVREAALVGSDGERTLPLERWDSNPLDRLRELEEGLDMSAHQPLEALRPVLESLDADLLKGLAEVARDPDLASLCSALALLMPLGTLAARAARHRLLEALGTLPTHARARGVREFRALLAACVRAAEVEEVESFGTWVPGDLREVAGASRLLLHRLEELAGTLTDPTCAALSAVAAHLDDLRFEVERDLPEPERSLFRLVADSWSETIQRGIEEMLAGAHT